MERGNEERGVRLDVLDPGSRDPGYWERFHGMVLTRAARELARRHAAGAGIGVTELVLRWSRAVVPAALAAAAAGGLLLVRAGAAPEREPLALEELLVPEDAGPLGGLFTAREAGEAAALVLASDRY